MANSRKRVHNTSKRYFNEERVSFPQLKTHVKLDNEIPFGMKKVSWAQEIKHQSESLSNLHDYNHLRTFSNEDRDEINKNNLYYQPVKNRKKLLSPTWNNECLKKIPFLKSSRNFKTKASNSSKRMAGIKRKISLGETKYSLAQQQAQIVYNSTVLDKEEKLGSDLQFNTMSNTLRPEDRESHHKEPPATPSFPNR